MPLSTNPFLVYPSLKLVSCEARSIFGDENIGEVSFFDVRYHVLKSGTVIRAPRDKFIGVDVVLRDAPSIVLSMFSAHLYLIECSTGFFPVIARAKTRVDSSPHLVPSFLLRRVSDCSSLLMWSRIT